MDGFDQQAATALADNSGENGWLQDYRTQNRSAWQESQWPNSKTEAWKYTPLTALDQGDFLRFATQQDNNVSEASYDIEGLDCQRLVFVNGRLTAPLSQLDNPRYGLTHNLGGFPFQNICSIAIVGKYDG